MTDRLLLVFANLAGGGILRPGMSGGDRIAIECLKRWAHAFQRILIVTTPAGKAIYVRNSVLQADYFLSTNMILPRHSLLNNIALQLIAMVKSLFIMRRLFEHMANHKVVLYSASDFPGDFFPALMFKILIPRFKWLASFFLFAPPPFSQANPYRGTRVFRAALWHMAQIPILRLTKLFADLVFVTNEPDRRRVGDGKNLSLDRVLAVRGGVDLKLSQDIPESPTKSYDAVFVGRLHPQKGVLELVEIWKLVCGRLPRARLAVIGNGELEGELRRRMAKHRMSENVELLGFLDGRDKINVFKQSKIVLHPALYDSGGMAPAEAMACGLPGICFDLPVLKSYYPKGLLRVPRYDLERFAETILLLLNDTKLYATLSAEALEETKAWDWDRRAGEILEVIRSHL